MLLRKLLGRENTFTVSIEKLSAYKWTCAVLTCVVQGSAVQGQTPQLLSNSSNQ